MATIGPRPADGFPPFLLAEEVCVDRIRPENDHKYLETLVTERTFVMVKPDGIGRRLCGEVIRRFETKGLRLAGLKMQIMTEDLARRHYEEHKERPFFNDLVGFVTSGPTVQMVWVGEGAVDVVRKINGATNSREADLGTIRGDYGLSLQNNIVHASDSVDTAKREIALYFEDSELWDYEMPDGQWLS